MHSGLWVAQRAGSTHMRLDARILCGLTLATAGQLHAQDPTAREMGSLQSDDSNEQALAATLLPQESTQQASPSQPNVPPGQQDPHATPPEGVNLPPTVSTVPQNHADQLPWLDRTRQGLYDLLWHNAMRVDRWFGSTQDESEYRKVYGSIAQALLWDKHYGFSMPFRFNVNLPLPQIDQRFHAFIGRFDPNEVVTESSQPSGAFRRQYGPSTEDQTLFGLAFHQPPRQGGYFDAGAGLRITLPLDPYVKGSY